MVLRGNCVIFNWDFGILGLYFKEEVMRIVSDRGGGVGLFNCIGYS